MQFFSIVQKGDLFGQDVLNIHWYRRDATGLPNEDDLAAVRQAWDNAMWPKFAAVLTSDYKLVQTIVQGWSGEWVRTPYLPRITDYANTPGTAAPPTASPLIVGILSARVVPVIAGPKIKNGQRVNVPVRRGYWAISGLPRDGFLNTGLMSPEFRESPNMAALAVAMNDEFAATTAPELLQPIKVSQPLPGETLRGYGMVYSATWRSEQSARRSRKVGKGG